MANDELNFIKEDGRIYANGDDGGLLCEVCYESEDENTVNIYRTFVDSSLGGRGIAGQLVTMAVEDLEAAGKNIVATCSYAQKWLEKNRGQESDRPASCSIRH